MRQHSGTLERKWNRQLNRPYFSGRCEKCGLGTRLPPPPPPPRRGLVHCQLCLLYCCHALLHVSRQKYMIILHTTRQEIRMLLISFPIGGCLVPKPHQRGEDLVKYVRPIPRTSLKTLIVFCGEFSNHQSHCRIHNLYCNTSAQWHSIFWGS